MIDERWKNARRILAVRLDNLGDVLVTTPAFHAIATSLPGAELTLLASPVGAQAGYLNPDITDVIVYEAPWMDPWQRLPQDGDREQAMIRLIKEREFDAAIIFTSFRQSALPAAYLCYLAGIPLRAAASIDGPGSLLTTRHKHPDRPMHEVERGLDLVSAIGCSTDERDLVLRVPEDARKSIQVVLAGANTTSPTVAQGFSPFRSGVEHVSRNPNRPVVSGPDNETVHGAETAENDQPERAKALGYGGEAAPFQIGADAGRTEPEGPVPTELQSLRLHLPLARARERGPGGEGISRPLIVLHPGCSMPARTYPWELFAEAADLLIERLGATVVLTGGEGEAELTGRVAERMRWEPIDFAGKLDFPELCALIEAADLTVTNNTGPMHIAAAVKTPVVALFALTNPPEQWGPWQAPHRLLYHDVPCRLCYSRVCPYTHDCLRLVEPAEIVAAARDLIAVPLGAAS